MKAVMDLNNLEEFDINKIRNCIQVIEDFERKCQQEQKFVEAGLAKERLKELQRLEEVKTFQELNKDFENQIKILEEEQFNELNEHNKAFDKELLELNKKFEDINHIMAEKFKAIQLLSTQIGEKIPQAPKPTTEIIQLRKTLDELSKQRDYAQAHALQIKLAKLTDIQKTKWEKEREKKIEIEVTKLYTKYKKEENGIRVKLESTFLKFKKRRAVAFDKLIQKFKNKKKELSNCKMQTQGKLMESISKASQPGKGFQEVPANGKSHGA